VSNKLSGKVQTVLGPIAGEDVGVALPHEHLFVDLGCYALEPTDPAEKVLARQNITLENLAYHRHHIFCGADNMVLRDEDTAIKEARFFKDAGGKTIFDLTPIGVGRSPNGLVKVARATGLNVIMGTAYYVALSFTPEMKIGTKTEKDIAAEFVREIREGVDQTGIKAGIIGEIGCSWPLHELEKKVLRAAAIAQGKTGAAISIHPGPHPRAPFEIVDILKKAGADISRVVFGHMTRTFPANAWGARAKLCENGCYVEEDWFGREGELPVSLISRLAKVTDTQRILMLWRLIQAGFLENILISHDICFKVMLQSYGGGGYSYILQFTVPEMRKMGLMEKQIRTILVDNPRRIATFV
jgi:phosphotriesterase-related protein